MLSQDVTLLLRGLPKNDTALLERGASGDEQFGAIKVGLLIEVLDHPVTILTDLD